MKKNSLTPNKGLSLSQAQSVSNLCNQRALEIERTLSSINNYSKAVKVGNETTPTIIEKGVKLPDNVDELILEDARLHACQGFLMENIKAKDGMLQLAKREVADVKSVKFPEKPQYSSPEQLIAVSEDFGWEQLTEAEMNEFYEVQAYAAHIGEFIHGESILDHLRNELPHIPAIEWMEVEKDKKTPVYITVHHNADDLLKLHEKLAELHRKYEQRVNYFKSKVKNLTTEENARIAKVNADAQAEAEKTNADLRTAFELENRKATEAVQGIKNEFEKTRHAKIKEVATMRITVDPRFASVVDEFLKKLPDSEETK